MQDLRVGLMGSVTGRCDRFVEANASLLPVAVFALSLCLNLVRLDATALWNDEAYSILAAWDGVRTVIRVILDDNQPPLYYLVLSLWIGIGGAGIFWVRLLSALAVAVAAGLVFASARQMFGWRIGLIAGVLFAIAPLEVSWAQKARPYPLQVLFCAVAFWGSVRVLAQDLASDTRPQTGSNVRGRFQDVPGWGAYAVGAAGAMLAQHTAGFFLLALNVGLILAVATSGRLHRRWILSWFAAQVCAVLIWSLWLPGFVLQITRLFGTRLTHTAASIFYPTWESYFWAIAYAYTVFDVWHLLLVAVPLYVLLFLSAAVLGRRYRPWSYLILATAVVPLLCSLAGFVFIHPIFGYVMNTFVWLEIPVSMVVATGVATLPTVWLRSAVLVLLVAMNVLGLRNYYHTDHVRLDLIADRMAQNLRPDDAVIVTENGAASCGLRYYLIRSGIQPPPGIRDACTGNQDRIFSTGVAQQYQRIWALTAPDGQLPFDPAAPPLGYTKAYDNAVGDIHLQRFDKPGQGG